MRRRSYYSERKSPLKWVKYILMVSVLALVGLMVYNSQLLVKMGIKSDPVPAEFRVNHLDERILSVSERVMGKDAINHVFDNMWRLLKAELNRGELHIVAKDEKYDFPLSGVEFKVTNAVDGTYIDTVRTDEKGLALVPELKHQTAYQVEAVSTLKPFKAYGEPIYFTMDADEVHVTFNFQVKDHVKRYEINEQGQLVIQETFIDIPLIMQEPELPNGCEIVAMASALQFYGYQADKINLAMNFLPRSNFYRVEGELYGPHPDVAFAGEPESRNGFYVFAPPVVKAANDYIESVSGNHRAVDLTGSTKEDIMAYVYEGRPVVIWVTLDLSPARINYSWHLDDGSGELYEAFVNLHCMVIHGFNGDTLYVMDPLKGLMEYPKETFFESYETLGSRAIILEEVSNES